MPKMKDSKAKWLGDIPVTWGISRIGSVYTLRNIKVSDRDYEPLSVTMKGVVPQLKTAAKTNAHDDRKLVKKGDFAINSRSDRRGSCGISDRDGSVSLINTILCPKGDMNPRYYNWLFHTEQFADEFYANGHGIVDDLWTTGWQEMKNILIPLPSLAEQRSIAEFLDRKCSEIDTLFADIEKQIGILEEYKKSIITEAVTKGLNLAVEMKASGIEWIGEIPRHWDISRLGYECYIRARLGWKGLKAEEYVDEGYAFISAFNIQNNQIVWEPLNYITKQRYDESPEIKIQIGDILIVKDGAGIGKTARIDDLPAGETAPNSSLGVLTPYENLNYRYCSYYLQCSIFGNHILRLLNGMGVPHLTQEQLRQVKILLPSLTEQNEISDYLDAKCREINYSISEKKKQLEILVEYKKSIIYEYVTGKKEIPAEVESTVGKLDLNAILLGIIANKLGKYQTGKIQIQKILYLACEHLGLNTQAQYYRYNHGPYDVNLDCYIDDLTKNQWFEEKKKKSSLLIPGKNNKDFLNKHKAQIEKYSSKIVDLLNLLFKMNSLKRRRLERIATLYAAWNDFLLDDVEPTDAQIIKEVMTNWTDNKSHTQYSTWQASLNEMKNNGLIPKGVGLHTLKKA